jgi:hypothetical protein
VLPQELEAQVEDMHKAMAELAASEREQRQVAQAAAVRADDAEQLSRQLEREVTDLGNQVAVLQNKLGAGGWAGRCAAASGMQLGWLH